MLLSLQNARACGLSVRIDDLSLPVPGETANQQLQTRTQRNSLWRQRTDTDWLSDIFWSTGSYLARQELKFGKATSWHALCSKSSFTNFWQSQQQNLRCLCFTYIHYQVQCEGLQMPLFGLGCVFKWGVLQHVTFGRENKWAPFAPLVGDCLFKNKPIIPNTFFEMENMLL